MKSEKKQIDKIWRWIFFALAALGLIIIVRLAKDAGMSGDEEYHYDHAVNVYNYYSTFGKDSTAAIVTEKYNLPLYGQSVDNLAYFITKTFNIEDAYGTRHIVNSIFGWLAMLFVGLIAYRIAGWRAAVISFILIFLSPRFLGHSFNNLKDLPLATGMAMGTYFLVCFFQEFPKIKIKTVIFLTLAIAFAISVRIAGLLLFAYFGLFGAILYFIRNRKSLFSKSSKQEFIKMLGWGIGISLVAFLLAVVTWPYALKAPVNNMKEALSSMSSFAIAIRQLFEGQIQWSDLLPWYYTPKFIFITIPIAVMLGLLSFLIFCWKEKKNYFIYSFIVFSFVFPVFWIVYQQSNVYGGWRHAMFAYPTMVVTAGLGFNLLIEWISKKTTKNALINIAAFVVIFLLLWNPIRHIVKNHPYEYVYFNELSGGINKVYGNHEMDYYYHSTREASEWVIANAQRSGLETGDKIKVATWHIASVKNFFRNDTADFQIGFSRWYEKGNNDWDYAIFTITGMMPEEIKNANFPPKNTVYQVKVDDKPIALVLKRETKDDLIGSQLKNRREHESAIYHLRKAIEIDPTNISAFMNLIESYFNTGKIDSAKIYIDQLLEFVPKYEPANYMLTHYYNATHEYDKALKVLRSIREDSPKFKAAYHFAFQIYVQQNDLKNAEKMMLDLLALNQLDEQGFNQLIAVYKAQGLDERAAYRKAYKKYIEAFEKLGKEKQAQIYRDALKKL